MLGGAAHLPRGQRQDGDPATVDLTITLPITVARTLGLVAAVEERAIEAVVVEAVMQFTGFDAVLAMAADKPVPEEQQAESPRP